MVEMEEHEDEMGDAAELARWLLRELAEAGSNKKKVGRVRLQLLALDVPLASAVACLSEICHRTPPPADRGARSDEAAAAEGRGRGGDDPAAAQQAAARFESLKQQTLVRLEEQLPEKRSTYEKAADLTLEYVGELISLAAGSTNTLFARLAPDAGRKTKYVAPTGGSLPAPIRRQVETLVRQVLQRRAHLSPTQLYRLLRLSKLAIPDLYSAGGDGLTPEEAGGYIQAAVASGGYEYVPSALVKALACPLECYPPSLARAELARQGLWGHAEQVTRRLGGLPDAKALVRCAECAHLGLRVAGLGLRVQGVGCRVRVYG